MKAEEKAAADAAKAEAAKLKAEEKAAADAAKAEAGTAKKTSATVVWRMGTRTYTKAIHGDDFLDLAKQFVAKHGGVIE